jgi:hypothetical protein
MPRFVHTEEWSGSFGQLAALNHDNRRWPVTPLLELRRSLETDEQAAKRGLHLGSWYTHDTTTTRGMRPLRSYNCVERAMGIEPT